MYLRATTDALESDQERAAHVPGVPKRDHRRPARRARRANMRVGFPGSMGVGYFEEDRE
jgi:hypothetical protein